MGRPRTPKAGIPQRAPWTSRQGIDKGEQRLDLFGQLPLVGRGHRPQIDFHIESCGPEEPFQCGDGGDRGSRFVGRQRGGRGTSAVGKLPSREATPTTSFLKQHGSVHACMIPNLVSPERLRIRWMFRLSRVQPSDARSHLLLRPHRVLSWPSEVQEAPVSLQSSTGQPSSSASSRSTLLGRRSPRSRSFRQPCT
jgi:hypothetical protein